MKKTLYIAAAVIAVMFAASCQKDDVQAAKKGMTLSANVEETKAIIEKDGSVWHFNWEAGDVVRVTSPSGKSYDFTYDGTSFKCETAVPEAGTWTAVYPANFKTDGIDLKNQDGTIRSAMSNFYMECDFSSSGSSTLSCTMNPQLAVLAVTFTAKASKCTIMAASGAGYYKKLKNDGKWELSTSPIYFPATTSASETQYFVVPAGVSIMVVSGTYSKDKILDKGKVYTLLLAK